jgi:hypothetical protein
MSETNIKNEESTIIDLKTNIENDLKDINLSEISKKVNNYKELDPTRFGDWEKNGRCSDF